VAALNEISGDFIITLGFFRLINFIPLQPPDKESCSTKNAKKHISDFQIIVNNQMPAPVDVPKRQSPVFDLYALYAAAGLPFVRFSYDAAAYDAAAAVIKNCGLARGGGPDAFVKYNFQASVIKH